MILFSELLEMTVEAERPRHRSEPCCLVKVPDHIWGALAMQNGMPYQIVLYTNPEGVLLNEIVCTSQPSEQWQNLWRLKIAFRDSAGLLADLAKLLQAAQLNIVSCRAETTEPDGIGMFELLLDARGYTPRPPGLTAGWAGTIGETLPEVRAQIVTRFSTQVVFYNDRALFSLRRVPEVMIASDKTRNDGMYTRTFYLKNRSLPIPI